MLHRDPVDPAHLNHDFAMMLDQMARHRRSPETFTIHGLQEAHSHFLGSWEERVAQSPLLLKKIRLFYLAVAAQHPEATGETRLVFTRTFWDLLHDADFLRDSHLKDLRDLLTRKTDWFVDYMNHTAPSSAAAK